MKSNSTSKPDFSARPMRSGAASAAAAWGGHGHGFRRHGVSCISELRAFLPCSFRASAVGLIPARHRDQLTPHPIEPGQAAGGSRSSRRRACAVTPRQECARQVTTLLHGDQVVTSPLQDQPGNRHVGADHCVDQGGSLAGLAKARSTAPLASSWVALGRRLGASSFNVQPWPKWRTTSRSRSAIPASGVPGRLVAKRESSSCASPE